jgi:hypothetical protein
MEATSKWHKFLGLPKWSPEIVPIGLLKLCKLIILDCRVRSQRGLNQICSLHRDLFNSMLHSQIGCREEVDSRLLVVGSQTASLTPGPSFTHNLGFKCPNDQCEAIFDIYVSRPFQWHQEHLNTRCFGPCCRTLNIRESRRTPNPQLWKCWASPPTLGQSGVVKDFHNLHWIKRISSRRGHEKLGGEEFMGGLFLMLLFLGRGGEGWWVLVDGGKKENGLDVLGTLKK